jgi:hypothetical protein
MAVMRLVFLAATASVLASCSSFPSLCEGAACAAATQDGGKTDGGQTVGPPAGCDPKVDAKDAPACVDDQFAVFVDPTSGNDANAGTKAAPVRQISVALTKRAGKPRIYLCEGDYHEHVVLADAVSLYGGFACGGWSYTGNKAKLAPSEKGYALKITNAPGVTVSDLDIKVLDATDPSESSIAVFVASSTATFTRVVITAGKGIAGNDKVQKAKDVQAPSGTAGATTEGGPGATNACSPDASKGGNGARVARNDATAGTPALGEGAAGQSLTQTCSLGGGQIGQGGASGDAANAVSAWGQLDESSWTPTAGLNGQPGKTGQGGGGGGSNDQSGGGGGAGGCGGVGGEGGGGGGASVALALVGATAQLNASQLNSMAAGAGGAGAAGQPGQPPGGPGAAGPTHLGDTFPGCPGGAGGIGGSGGAGGGGAGGISTAILYKGAQPTVDPTTTLTPGAAGDGGKGGAASNAGPNGKNDPMVAIP